MASKLFDLSGRVALVTGGSKGLGKAMALGFAQAGADVVISSRHENELQAAAREIRSGSQARVEYVVADMTQRERGRPARPGGHRDHEPGRYPGQQRGQQSPPADRPDPGRGLGSARRAEPQLVHGASPRARAVHERAAMGPDHPHLVDHGLQLGRRPQCLLGHQERTPGPGPGQRQRPGPLRHHGQLHRPRPVPHRPAQEPALPGKAG